MTTELPSTMYTYFYTAQSIHPSYIHSEYELYQFQAVFHKFIWLFSLHDTKIILILVVRTNEIPYSPEQTQ